MTTIKINSQDIDYIFTNDDWKDYVIDDFDKKIVIHGNNHFDSIDCASWYEKTLDVMKDIDLNFEEDDIYDLYKNDYTIEQWQQLLDIYKHCRYYDDDETILKALEVIYPERHFESGTIKGSSQGDWNTVLYDSDKFDDISRLEDFYWGNVSEIYVMNDNDEIEVTAIVTNSDIWDAERNKLREKRG